MYNILELRSKSQDELLRIAQELGVKKANSLAPDALVYAILDQQAIVTSVDKKEEGKTKKQRARITKKVVTEEGGIGVIEKTVTAEPKANKKAAESPVVVASDTTTKEPIVVEKTKETNKNTPNKQKNKKAKKVETEKTAEPKKEVVAQEKEVAPIQSPNNQSVAQPKQNNNEPQTQLQTPQQSAPQQNKQQNQHNTGTGQHCNPQRTVKRIAGRRHRIVIFHRKFLHLKLPIQIPGFSAVRIVQCHRHFQKNFQVYNPTGI